MLIKYNFFAVQKNSNLVLCKILRTILKTVGDHCFFNALVQIPLYKQKHKKNKHKNVLVFFRVSLATEIDDTAKTQCVQGVKVFALFGNISLLNQSDM